MSVINTAPQPNFTRVKAGQPLKPTQQQRLRDTPILSVLLHAIFIVVAFGTALGGGYLLSSPAEGFALNIATITELPVLVAIVNCTVFLVAWRWAVAKAWAWLEVVCPARFS